MKFYKVITKVYNNGKADITGPALVECDSPPKDVYEERAGYDYYVDHYTSYYDALEYSQSEG